MASKTTFSTWILIAAWVVWPTESLQGEPPAWLGEGEAIADVQTAAVPANQPFTAPLPNVPKSSPQFLPVGNQSADAAVFPASSNVAPSLPLESTGISGAAVPASATGGVALPQPAPMFPAGPSLAAAGDMIGFSRELAGGTQAITLINASRRWMAVYHVDQAGQIRLVSSRPLDADFSFQFNATAPLPEEIRRLQGR